MDIVMDVTHVWVVCYVEKHTKKLLTFNWSRMGGRAYCRAKSPDDLEWKNYPNKSVGIPHWHGRTLRGYYTVERVTKW